LPTAITALRAAPDDPLLWRACAAAAPDFTLTTDEADLLARLFAHAATASSPCDVLRRHDIPPPALTFDLDAEGLVLCKVGANRTWPVRRLAPTELTRAVAADATFDGLDMLATRAASALELEGDIEVTANGSSPVQLTRWYRVVTTVQDATRERELAEVQREHVDAAFVANDDLGVPLELESAVITWLLLAALRRARPLEHEPPDEAAALEAALALEAQVFDRPPPAVLGGLEPHMRCHTRHDYVTPLELDVVEGAFHRYRVVEAVRECPGPDQALADELGVPEGQRVAFSRGEVPEDVATDLATRALDGWFDSLPWPDGDDDALPSTLGSLLPLTAGLALALVRRMRVLRPLVTNVGATGAARRFDDYATALAFEALPHDAQVSQLLVMIRRACADVPGLEALLAELLDPEGPTPGPGHLVYQHFSDHEDFARHFLVLYLGDLVADAHGKARPSRGWAQDGLTTGVLSPFWLDEPA